MRSLVYCYLNNQGKVRYHWPRATSTVWTLSACGHAFWARGELPEGLDPSLVDPAERCRGPGCRQAWARWAGGKDERRTNGHSRFPFEQLQADGDHIAIPAAALERDHPNHLRGCAYMYAKRRGFKVSVTRVGDAFHVKRIDPKGEQP